MAFSLNDFKPSENNYTSKILLPGTHMCKVLDLKLEKPPYDNTQYNLVFLLEGPAITEEGFQGIQKDRNDASKGNYAGQIASVKSSQYAFKDWDYKGKAILRDESIQMFIGTFLQQVGLLAEVQKADIHAENIEEFVAEIKYFLLKADRTFAFTIGGQKYFKEGYDNPNYSLYLPKRNAGKFAYAATVEDPNFFVFDEEQHIYERKAAENADTSAEVSSFAPPAAPIANKAFETFAAPTPAPAENLFENNVNDLQLP